jgi:hypothetical protein
MSINYHRSAWKQAVVDYIHARVQKSETLAAVICAYPNWPEDVKDHAYRANHQPSAPSSRTLTRWYRQAYPTLQDLIPSSPTYVVESPAGKYQYQDLTKALASYTRAGDSSARLYLELKP